MYSDAHSLDELLSLQQKVKEQSIEVVASELRLFQTQVSVMERVESRRN